MSDLSDDMGQDDMAAALAAAARDRGPRRAAGSYICQYGIVVCTVLHAACSFRHYMFLGNTHMVFLACILCNSLGVLSL